MSPLCIRVVNDVGTGHCRLRGIPSEARKAVLDRVAPSATMRLRVEERTQYVKTLRSR